VNTPTGIARARDCLLDLLGQLPKGSKLPGERILADSFGVSRMTLRKAIESLIHDGHLIAHPRSGTFIIIPIIASGLKLSSWTEQMKTLGMKPTSKIISFKTVPANRDIASILKIADKSMVYQVKRIRFGDDVPLGIEKLHISQSAIGTLVREDLCGSLYQHFEERCGIFVHQASTSISAYLPNLLERSQLMISDRVACLKMKAIDISQWGDPVMLAECVYRGDLYKLKLNLMKSSPFVNFQEETDIGLLNLPTAVQN
jgi:GntR family transcriptional regulator